MLVLTVCATRLYDVLCVKVVAECALKGLTELCQPRSEKLGMTKKRRGECYSDFDLSLVDLSLVYKRSKNNC